MQVSDRGTQRRTMHNSYANQVFKNVNFLRFLVFNTLQRLLLQTYSLFCLNFRLFKEPSASNWTPMSNFLKPPKSCLAGLFTDYSQHHQQPNCWSSPQLIRLNVFLLCELPESSPESGPLKFGCQNCSSKQEQPEKSVLLLNFHSSFLRSSSGLVR